MTNLILFVAMAIALVLILKTRWCSVYRQINTTPVLTVMCAYMISYFVAIICAMFYEEMLDLFMKKDYSTM